MQIGPKETTYGTYIAPTAKLEVFNFEATPEIGVIQDPSLYSQPSRRGLYQGGQFWRVRFTVRGNFDGCLELFRAVFGTYSNTLVDTPARDHFFKEGANLNSYSPEAIVGDVTTGKCFRVLGLKLTGVRVRGTAGLGNDAMLQFEFNGLAKDVQSNQTPTGALTFPAVLPILYHYSGNATGIVDDGTADTGVSLRVRSFEVSLEQPHTEDRSYLQSINIDEPMRSDFLVARWRLTQEFTTYTQFDAAKAFTVGSPKLVFAHPTTIGSTSKREFELRSNQANLVEYSNPVEGYGVILSTATWEAFFDATDASALVARFRNTESALP